MLRLCDLSWRGNRMAEQIGCRKLESSGKRFDHLQLFGRGREMGDTKSSRRIPRTEELYNVSLLHLEGFLGCWRDRWYLTRKTSLCSSRIPFPDWYETREKAHDRVPLLYSRCTSVTRFLYQHGLPYDLDRTDNENISQKATFHPSPPFQPSGFNVKYRVVQLLITFQNCYYCYYKISEHIEWENKLYWKHKFVRIIFFI